MDMPGGFECPIARIHVCNIEVSRATDLAVIRMLCQEDRLTLSRELGKDRKAGFMSILPSILNPRPWVWNTKLLAALVMRRTGMTFWVMAVLSILELRRSVAGRGSGRERVGCDSWRRVR